MVATTIQGRHMADEKIHSATARIDADLIDAAQRYCDWRNLNKQPGEPRLKISQLLSSLLRESIAKLEAEMRASGVGKAKQPKPKDQT